MIDGSKGTRFENAAADFHQAMAENVADHLAAYNRKQGQAAFDQRDGRSRSLLCRDTSKSSAATGIRKTANKWFANMSLFGIKACGRFCEKGARVFGIQ
ncbi:hypothetical protein VQ056_33390 [Paenibacillus sp. JTLBN-2024]